MRPNFFQPQVGKVSGGGFGAFRNGKRERSSPLPFQSWLFCNRLMMLRIINWSLSLSCFIPLAAF